MIWTAENQNTINLFINNEITQQECYNRLYDSILTMITIVNNKYGVRLTDDDIQDIHINLYSKLLPKLLVNTHKSQAVQQYIYITIVHNALNVIRKRKVKYSHNTRSKVFSDYILDNLPINDDDMIFKLLDDKVDYIESIDMSDEPYQPFIPKKKRKKK